jgi:hypothetical protein
MRSGLLIPLILLGLTVSCSQKKICPAYQSSFIYDKETLKKKFSYFEADSTPRVFASAAKTKYLVAVPESYRKKYQRLQTVEMKPVYPPKPDSLQMLALQPADSDSSMVAGADSVRTNAAKDESGLVQKSPDFKITKTREKYTSDQEYYMWFFRKSLILPDIRYHMEKKRQPLEQPVKSTELKAQNTSSEDSGKKPFLKLPSFKSRTAADSISGQGKN